MTYYEDLTPYEYGRDQPEAGTVNVGWLSRYRPFNKGETPDAFKARLFEFCLDGNLVRFTRGFHVCEFCGIAEGEWFEKHPQYDEGGMGLGNGEIRVIGEGVVYAAPALIYHYVVQHGYRPPDEFVTAIMDGSGPDSQEHRALRGTYNG